MSLDLLTAATGIFSFVAFLSVHLLIFRWVEPEHLLKALLVSVLIFLALPLLLMAFWCSHHWVMVSRGLWLWAGFLAVAVEGLLCLFYVLCIFGPYETSVRMRLVREIAKHALGISRHDLLLQYNAEKITDIRLRRLLGAGDLIEKAGRYQATGRGNLFFVFDFIAGVIKKWIG